MVAKAWDLLACELAGLQEVEPVLNLYRPCR